MLLSPDEIVRASLASKIEQSLSPIRTLKIIQEHKCGEPCLPCSDTRSRTWIPVSCTVESSDAQEVTTVQYTSSTQTLRCQMPMIQAPFILYTYNKQGSTSVLHNLGDELSILHETPELLWRWTLFVVTVLILWWQIDVHTARFAREDFRPKRLLAQVNLCAVHLVHQYCRYCAKNLDGEIGALDHIDGRDERVDDDRCAWGVVNADSVAFASYSKCCLVAFRDED